ncbi:biotin transporter BioY [Exiguobacterium sp. AM39-5BH]|uniref:biotin transporter BioY n=1 Tax=Exiguobacterium sp. AM39-5BH TaxID=2292355 RepID=UPI000FE20351|nr:biotin transporter BioY [Exiguobacterium sp. AM39-5BH]RHB51989.1 biotin transporter BioY [Exiguobacterium sp. AM39-5BH]
MKIHDLTQIAIGAALLASIGSIAIPIGPVPITLQMLGIMTVASVLGAKKGGLAVIVYLLLGLIGLPVLSGSGGLAPFVGPTVGYLLAFPIAAFLIGWLSERHRSFPALVSYNVVIGLGLVYILGSLGLQAVYGLTFIEALKVNIPFILGDSIKAVLAAAIAYKVSTNPQIRRTLAS